MSRHAAGLSFNAQHAIAIRTASDMRFMRVFNQILVRCLTAILQAAPRQNSIVFRVPTSLAADVTPYNVEDAVRYLLVALRDDRGFVVMWDGNVSNPVLYIRWETSAQRKHRMREFSQTGKPPAIYPAQMPRTVEVTVKKTDKVATCAEGHDADNIDVDSVVRDAERFLKELG